MNTLRLSDSEAVDSPIGKAMKEIKHYMETGELPGMEKGQNYQGNPTVYIALRHGVPISQIKCAYSSLLN